MNIRSIKRGVSIMRLRPISLFLGFYFALSSTDTLACSFYKLEPFLPSTPSHLGTGEKPNIPRATFEVHRGQLGDGNSCDDTGVVTLLIDVQENQLKEIGYSIEVIDNTTGQELFPNYVFYTTRYENGQAKFYFPWVDGASDIQEPIKIVFKLVAVSRKWVKSEAVIVTIEDNGRL
jgi:hypothetical protein